MKRGILFCGVFFSIIILCAQPYAIGHKQKTYIDIARSNRSIVAEIYYPANSAGDNVSVASGKFPVIAFGHGFIMETSAYDVVWKALVPKGYILILPTTESSISPSHLDFGKDLSYLIAALKKEGKQPTSEFFNTIANACATMGHSMGGGAAFLAMSLDTSITAMVTFAAAVTNPSSIAAAKNINKPSLVFSASADCVAPAASHQTPMYDSLASNCKTFVSITGGSHCQFANNNVACSLGEVICFPKASVNSGEQQKTTFDLMIHWLNFYLKNEVSGATDFQLLITGGKGISSRQNCSLNSNTGIINEMTTGLNYYPNPSFQEVTVFMPTEGQIDVYSPAGQLTFSKRASIGHTLIPLALGTNFLRITCGERVQTFIVLGE
jgi:pimeloyl-ACP methyl ester carboxylesterase